jgi:hypothetical protein
MKRCVARHSSSPIQRQILPSVLRGADVQGVASCSYRDQVLFGIVAGVTAKLFVMDLKFRHRATRLISPACSVSTV